MDEEKRCKLVIVRVPAHQLAINIEREVRIENGFLLQEPGPERLINRPPEEER